MWVGSRLSCCVVDLDELRLYPAPSFRLRELLGRPVHDVVAVVPYGFGHPPVSPGHEILHVSLSVEGYHYMVYARCFRRGEGDVSATRLILRRREERGEVDEVLFPVSPRCGGAEYHRCGAPIAGIVEKKISGNYFATVYRDRAMGRIDTLVVHDSRCQTQRRICSRHIETV